MGATPIPQELTNAWQLTLEFWGEQVRHNTVLGLAAKHTQLAWLAGKYRDAARSNPFDPIAQARLLRVRNAAALVFELPKTAPEPTKPRKSYRAVQIMLIGAMIMTGLGYVITDQRIQQQQRQPQPRTLVSRHP